MKIGIIGCGNMGEAILKGLVSSRSQKSKVCVVEKNDRRRDYIRRKYKISAVGGIRRLQGQIDTLIIAVKPQDIDGVLAEIMDFRTRPQNLISIAAGISTRYIEERCGKVPVVRGMPNAPGLIGCGITAVVRGRYVGKKEIVIAKNVFEGIGEVAEVQESLMDAVTAVSGSGPAYFYYLMDAMLQAAEGFGLNKNIARRLVFQTGLGSALTALKSGEELQTLIKRVASKGGTTEAALKVFNKRGMDKIIRSALKAAEKRAGELDDSAVENRRKICLGL